MWGNQKPQAAQPATVNFPEPAAPKWKPMVVEIKETAPSNDEKGRLNTPSCSTARLGTNLHVKGEISGNEDLHIDGRVEGLIQLEDCKLTVGASANLTADVIAREVVIYGSIKGNLRARDRIEIKKNGSAVGDLTTTRIMIEDGAYFKGSIEIDRTTSGNETDLDKPSYSRAAAAAPAHAIPPKPL